MKKLKLFASILAVTGVLLIIGPAYAFNPVDLEKLLHTGMCASCDLSGANLSYATWIDGSKCQGRSIGECKK